VSPVEVRIHNVTFDCADARLVASFWSAMTGWHLFYDDDPEVLVAPCYPPQGTGLLFIPVPEGKTVKNRVHLDLEPVAGTRDQLVEQALALGARVVADHRREDGTGWVTMADPEGNEFCLERGSAERGEEPRTIRIG
jgi:catechol 2,3-dioxygenase-like lactoylglutathione lyase family enzyme